jgi:hypothetical protein
MEFAGDSAQNETFDCGPHCRRLATATFALADGAEIPEIIGDYLAIAAKLLACAEQANGETSGPAAEA